MNIIRRGSAGRLAEAINADKLTHVHHQSPLQLSVNPTHTAYLHPHLSYSAIAPSDQAFEPVDWAHSFAARSSYSRDDAADAFCQNSIATLQHGLKYVESGTTPDRLLWEPMARAQSSRARPILSMMTMLSQGVCVLPQQLAS